MLDPEGATLLAELSFEALKDDKLDYIGGLEMGAVPLAGAHGAVLLDQGPSDRGVLRAQEAEGARREDWRSKALPKGESLKGKRVVIVEDVTTTGGSAMKAVESVREAGGEIVLVLHHGGSRRRRDGNFAQAGAAVPRAVQGERISQQMIVAALQRPKPL